MVIRATETELDLSGSPAELRSIATQFVQLQPGGRIRFAADETADPSPYARLLVAFEVVASNGAVKVSVPQRPLPPNATEAQAETLTRMQSVRRASLG